MVLLAIGMVFSPQLLPAQTALVGSLNNNLAPAQAVPPDSLVSLVADVAGLQLLSPEQVPATGTFWWVDASGISVPLPCPPADSSGAIYQIASGQYLVDISDGQVTLPPQRLGMQVSAAAVVNARADALANQIDQIQADAASETAQTLATGQRMSAMSTGGIPSPGGGAGDGSGDYTPNGSSSIIYNPTNLWIAQPAVAAGYLTGIGTNTLADVPYEIQSRTNLAQSDWQSEGFVLGSELTNWTPLSVAQNSRTNLFIQLRSWADDGSGLPIWWQLQYFGTTGIDPDAFDSAGDGYTIWQKYEMGLDPNAFYSPPAPQGLTVAGNLNNSTANISWQPAKGAVIGYTVGRYDSTTSQWQTFTVGLTNQFLDATFIQYPPWSGQIYYTIQANYGSGNSYWSPDQKALANNASTAQVLSGAGGSTVLEVLNLPADASSVHVTRVDWSNRNSYPPVIGGTNTFFIAAGSFINGFYTVPTNAVGTGYDGSSWYVQTVWSNGVSSTASSAGYLEAQTTYGGIPLRFNDCSAQLQQNAVFLLRAAGLNSPFVYAYDAGYGMTPVNQPTNYVFSSFWNMNYDTGDGLGDASVFFWGLPIEENYRLRDFVFSATNVDSSRTRHANQ